MTSTYGTDTAKVKNAIEAKYLKKNQGSSNSGKYLKVDSDGSVIPATGGGTTVEDNLTSQSTTNALSANQGRVLNNNKINTSDIADNLTTNDATKVLSAKQGKALADLIGDAISYINQ